MGGKAKPQYSLDHTRMCLQLISSAYVSHTRVLDFDFESMCAQDEHHRLHECRISRNYATAMPQSPAHVKSAPYIACARYGSTMQCVHGGGYLRASKADCRSSQSPSNSVWHTQCQYRTLRSSCVGTYQILHAMSVPDIA
eukprot:84815-Rhodomonas_salina.4